MTVILWIAHRHPNLCSSSRRLSRNHSLSLSPLITLTSPWVACERLVSGRETRRCDRSIKKREESDVLSVQTWCLVRVRVAGDPTCMHSCSRVDGITSQACAACYSKSSGLNELASDAWGAMLAPRLLRRFCFALICRED